MNQEEQVREKLKAIRELMYSRQEPVEAQVLELTEDDLFDEQQDEHYCHKSSVNTNNKENTFVNEILTQNDHNSMLKDSQEQLVSSENAAKSIETLKYLIKKLEKATEESAKINRKVTVEDAVTETLKPLLKNWLNEYLHSIVQGIVDKEVQILIAKKDKTNG